jgi:hypothetical protein
MNDEHQLLARAYWLFNKRDIDGVLALMHPDVDWPNGWEGGRVIGHEEVRDYWSRQWAALNPQVEPVGFTDIEGGILVDVHQVVHDHAGHLLIDQMVRHRYVVRDSRIARMDIVDNPA